MKTSSNKAKALYTLWEDMAGAYYADEIVLFKYRDGLYEAFGDMAERVATMRDTTTTPTSRMVTPNGVLMRSVMVSEDYAKQLFKENEKVYLERSLDEVMAHAVLQRLQEMQRNALNLHMTMSVHICGNYTYIVSTRVSNLSCATIDAFIDTIDEANHYGDVLLAANDKHDTDGWTTIDELQQGKRYAVNIGEGRVFEGVASVHRDKLTIVNDGVYLEFFKLCKMSQLDDDATPTKA